VAETLIRSVATPSAPATAPTANDNVPLETLTTVIVENMHCGGCMRSVEKALLSVPGVTAARANLSAKRATATHAAGKVQVEPLLAALAAAGFKAAELVEQGRDASKEADLDLLKRLGVAGFAAANIMLLSVSVWSGGSGDMGHAVQSLFHWLSALIALPAIAYAGQPFFRSAARALSVRRLNMDVPISLGVILATTMSLFQTTRGSEQVYFDAAITLLFFLLVGRFLDQRMRTRAAGAAANLIALQAMSATVLNADGTTERLPSRLLTPGMTVLVAPGERIAADGRVVEGTSDIDESLLTGETRPRAVAPGAAVAAGTVNLSGALRVRATATDDNTTLAEIGRLLDAAEQGRGRYVRLADRAARLYAPAVHILGAGTFIGWMALGAGWEPALTAAIAVLIITCPCALALAVPAVQVAATSRLFRRGLLVKAADGLERLAEVDTVVFDKTGTLSLGEPRFIGVGAGGSEVLGRAAELAAVSRHPYARAVVKAAEAAGLRVVPAAEVTETPGRGLARKRSVGEDRLGSSSWCGVEEDVGEDAPLWFRPAGREAIPLLFDDVLRPDAAEVVKALRAAGYEVELLSGDRPKAVADAARQAGIATFRARATPAEKIQRLEELKAAGRKVLMVGDGLNDAPALAAGHASLSPATAADISQTTADGIFQGARLEPVLEALRVAKGAHRMAIQNFAIAIGYNIFFVPLAMGGFVTPLIAAVAMSASSIAVTGNAVRLNSKRLELRS